MALFDEFPHLSSNIITIRKMEESDVDSLMEITSNDNVYRYIPNFLHNKIRGFLLTAIRNLGGRDFDKKIRIIAGIYLNSEPEKLVGLAEMFEYRKDANCVTIGYRINEGFGNRKIATTAIALMKDYLLQQEMLDCILAYAMPENVFSAKALLRNSFIKQDVQMEMDSSGGNAKAAVDVYAIHSAVK